MADKKYLFFDIDGTIWDEHRFIPDSAVAAIRRLREKGHETFLCSGRTMGHIFAEELLGIGFDGIISGCGTSIAYRGRQLLLVELSPEQVTRTLEVTDRYEFRTILEGPEHLYIDTDYFCHDAYGIKLMKEMEGKYRTIKDYYGRWRALKLSCDTKRGHQDECYEELKEWYDFIPHGPAVVEIVPRGYNKSTGITTLCRMVGIPMEDTIAFGDSTNDIEMLNTVGIGVAMGNGSENAKKAADLVTDTLKNDGIYKACVKLGLIEDGLLSEKKPVVDDRFL